MITIVSSSLDFQYDIQALTMAFFPAQKIMFSECEEASDIVIKIDLTEQICISFWEEGNLRFEEEEQAPIMAIQDRLVYKNALKRVLWRVLSEATGHTIPWGTLTGVRPTKIALTYLLEGGSRELVKPWLKEQFLCSEEKINLSVTIAEKEIELLQKLDYKNGYSIYIGIPFCPTTCQYCSFTSYSIDKYQDQVEGYLDALEKEIDYAVTCYPDKQLTTIYLGGGTPTTLSPEQLDRLLTKIKTTLPFQDVIEFTVEAGRPDSITRDKLEVLLRQGVTRISVNPQTMKQKTLDLIGRRHTVLQTKEAFLLAREMGFDNINMDLIVGLPEETSEDFEETLREVKALDPDSITIHSLVVKRASRLRTKQEEGKEFDDKEPLEGELEADPMGMMLSLGEVFAKENGYEPYYMYRQKNKAGLAKYVSQENIGYARKGKECLYNILIMEEKQTILALGAGAASKIVFQEENKVERIENVKSVTDYVSRIDEMIQRKKNFYNGNG